MSPILYIIFNRPDHTQRSFEQIRALAPAVLYVAADAPRQGREGESDRTSQARSITENIDWPCQVHRLYADENMGCGRRISSAITEVLKDHETVITLEDDCIVEPTFFPYCETLLDRYRDDQRIMAISGDNFQNGISRTDHSYYFSRYPHCWGWATWRRAWQHFDLNMTRWPEIRESNQLSHFCDGEQQIAYWQHMFDAVQDGRVGSWAFPWTLACWLQNGLTVLPNQNLVSNIGFDRDATHTSVNTAYAHLPTFPLGELNHSSEVFRHVEADRFTDDILYSGPWQRSRTKRRRLFSRKTLFGKRSAA
ncbi:MAG: glycosyltransferase family 2 protein [Rubripirellula sp.]